MTQLNPQKESPRALAILTGFLASESAGGIVLMVAALAAIIVANSPIAPLYFASLHSVWAGLSVELWINDGLMAIFFLMVGLEIKREVLAGGLASWGQRALPGFAAAGGMLVPALIYIAINMGNAETLSGWAIPAATDIAFALGVLSLLGKRVPTSLKVFLAALAILDDLGDDQVEEILALAWVGRGTYDPSEWDEALEAAADADAEDPVDQLLEMPTLAAHLEAGLAAFDLSCDGIGQID